MERHEPEQEYPVCRSGLHLRQREGCLPDGVVLGGGAVAQHGSGESLTAFPMEGGDTDKINWAESYPNWQRCVRSGCRYEKKEADGGTCTPLPVP